MHAVRFVFKFYEINAISIINVCINPECYFYVTKCKGKSSYTFSLIMGGALSETEYFHITF